jgi:hypothetical protein
MVPLELPGRAHDGGLAIAHGRRAEEVDDALHQELAELEADVEQA